MLTVKNLTKEFNSRIAIENISFNVRPGVITGLLGPNGAGKTTTMRILTGFLNPTSGNVFYGNNSEQLQSPSEIRNNMGYLPESAPLYGEMLLIEYLQYMGRIRGIEEAHLENRVDKMVEICGLSTHIYSQIGHLSKGYRQRVALAGTLIHDPEIIILDEPTSGLDPNQISHIRTLIKELGKEKTLILSTHILQEVEDICEDVIIISKGKIVANSSVAGLKKGNGVLFTVKAGLEKIQSLFPEKEFLSVRQHSESTVIPENYNSFLVEMEHEKPELVFSKLASTGLEVREIKIYHRSLESIFEELTRN